MATSKTKKRKSVKGYIIAPNYRCIREIDYVPSDELLEDMAWHNIYFKPV